MPAKLTVATGFAAITATTAALASDSGLSARSGRLASSNG